MICIKCGLDIEKPKETCPRCGNVLPRIEIERDEIEAGSLDAWSENAPITFVDAQRNMPKIPLISELVINHPSAWQYVGALTIRIVFYVINILAMLFSDWTMWGGIGLILNLIFASVAMLLVVFPPEDQDFYWLKPITTIVILADCALTWLIILGPLFLKLIDILITPFT